MKTLTLIRHAKSSWEDESTVDFDRPLNPRGKQDAPMMGTRLEQRNVLPDLIISSPAKRAKKTAKIIADKIHYEKDDIIFDNRLYLADISDLIISILENNQNAEHIMLCGHNPGMTDFSNLLADCGIGNVPTCGIVTIQFEMDCWEHIEQTKGKLLDFDYPKKEG